MPRIRRVQVFLGPFKDLLGKGKAGAKLIESTGLSNELKISFSVSKKGEGAPNEGAIVITNLAPDTIKILREERLSVELWGGYEDEEIRIIMKGGIFASIPKRNGAIIETTLTVKDGWGAMLDSDYGRSYAGNEPLDAIVRDIAKSFEGVKIGRIEVSAVLSSKGRVLSGNGRGLLDRLADQFGFAWSIQDGIFQAIDDKNLGGIVYNLDKTLIEITPTVNGPTQLVTAIDLIALLDPRILPGDTIEINPTVDTTLAGQYKVFSIDLNGSTHDEEWTASINSLSPPK